MKFLLLSILSVGVVVGGIRGDVGAESYWRSMLPNTPLPKLLQALLNSSGVQHNFSDTEPSSTAFFGTYEQERQFYNLGYWTQTRKFSKENTIPNTTVVFFLMADLLPNKTMRLNFAKSFSKSSFLPRTIADSIPFSDDGFLDILKHFFVKPGSKEAQIIKQTIQDCNSPSMEGEDKHCATSLESLVDLAIAKYGKNVRPLFNEVDEEYKEKDYVLKGIKEVLGNDPMLCHKVRYLYAVFYCHNLVPTKVYMVSLTGDDGSKAQAVTVCHMNTSAWNPKHLSFQVLNVKPGGPPICHFLNDDAIVWVPN